MQIVFGTPKQVNLGAANRDPNRFPLAIGVFGGLVRFYLSNRCSF